MSQGGVTIGCIGQGYVGKNCADDLESRGYSVVRYALEEPYRANRGALETCDLVFVAVPTPTTPEGFDDRIVREAIALTREGARVVIKSTLVPGTTRALQEAFPSRVLFYVPEFLSEATAAHDAAHPASVIIGLPVDDASHQEGADELTTLLPRAPHTLVCTSTEAEIIKYAHNGAGYVNVVFFNLMYDLAQSFSLEWGRIEEALRADPLIATTYIRPLHKSGRGAGGHCFIKDFAALRKLYGERLSDTVGEAALRAIEKKNLDLLRTTHKDTDLVVGVYGQP